MGLTPYELLNTMIAAKIKTFMVTKCPCCKELIVPQTNGNWIHIMEK